MSAEIKVQGETYRDLDELAITITVLEAQLEEMPSETPEHTKLAAHVAALRAAADGNGSASEVISQPPTASAEPKPSAEKTEDDEFQTTHDIQDAFDNGKIILCPTCGQEVPFPEAPPVDAFAERCDKCDGWGKVVTGSRVDGNGSGFTEKEGVQAAIPARTAAETPEAPGATWNADTQSWNPPPGVQPPWSGAVWDAFYGKWS